MDSETRKKLKFIDAFRWIARGLSVLSVLMLLMFLFGQYFDPAHVLPKQWVGMLFFPLGVVIGFFISWRFELVGGLISIASLIGFYLIYGLILSGRLPQGWAFLIFTIPAFLFIACELLARSALGKLAESR